MRPSSRAENLVSGLRARPSSRGKRDQVPVASATKFLWIITLSTELSTIGQDAAARPSSRDENVTHSRWTGFRHEARPSSRGKKVTPVAGSKQTIEKPVIHQSRDQVPVDHDTGYSALNDCFHGLTNLGSVRTSLWIAQGARPSSRDRSEIFQELADPILAIETFDAIGGGLLESVNPRSSAEIRAAG